VNIGTVAITFCEDLATTTGTCRPAIGSLTFIREQPVALTPAAGPLNQNTANDSFFLTTSGWVADMFDASSCCEELAAPPTNGYTADKVCCAATIAI